MSNESITFICFDYRMILVAVISYELHGNASETLKYSHEAFVIRFVQDYV